MGGAVGVETEGVGRPGLHWKGILPISHYQSLLVTIRLCYQMLSRVYLNMRRDYYSDVRVAERIIFQKSLYLLDNLEDKVDSFNHSKTPSLRRQREKAELLHPYNTLQPQTPNSRPLAHIANDLTKPLAQTNRLKTAAVCRRPQSSGTQATRCRDLIMLKFLQRFKNEHEDEGGLRLAIEQVDHQRLGEGSKAEPLRSSLQTTRCLVQELLVGLLRVVEVLEEYPEDRALIELRAAASRLRQLGSSSSQDGEFGLDSMSEIAFFVNTLEQRINSIAQCESGPTFVSYWPQVPLLSELIHPMLLAAHCFIKNQVKAHEKRSPPQQEGESVFGEMGDYQCSKVTLINLDGQDSPFNLLTAKSLTKYLQYISFPVDTSFSLSEQFLLGDLTQAGVEKLCRVFRVKEGSLKELAERYRRLLVFPLFSSLLADRLELPSIEPYYSSFVWFLMKEVVVNQVREFGPSIIVLSYSGQLSLKASHFEALLKELSLVNNMKLLLFHQPPPSNLLFAEAPLEGTDWRDQEGWSRLALSCQLLERVSIFLKVSSGVFSFSRLEEEDEDVSETFETFKVLEYTGKLLLHCCQNHPTLSKLRNRFIEYQRMQLVMTNYFRHNPPHPTVFSLYYKSLLTAAESLLANPPPSSPAQTARIKYGPHLQEHWQSFSDALALSTSKLREKETIKYFTKLGSFNQEPQSPYDIIALEFQLLSQPGNPLLLSPTVQVLLSKEPRDALMPVFLLNHLPYKDSPTLCNYAGLLDGKEERTERRVGLREVVFRQGDYQLGPHQHFCEFNYFETSQYVILFWPLLYDQQQAVLHAFAGTRYEPSLVPLFFLAPRHDPFSLVNSLPANKPSPLPRMGCTCYQPPHSDSIFVFGGFYQGSRSYLQIQTEITLLQVHSQQLLVDSIPSDFFLGTSLHAQLGRPQVTQLRNDFVRPRAEYQVHPTQREGDSSEIILFGGVGQKFMSPYSLLTHVGLLIRFHQNSLLSVRRIKLNNVVPSSLARPLRLKTEQEIAVVRTAQNRRIGTSQALLSPHRPAFLSFEYRYEKAVEEMRFTKSYEVGLRGEKEGEATGETQLACPNLQLLQLQLQLDPEQLEKFVNLQGTTVELEVKNVTAIHTYAAQLFALVQHPIYTEGRTVLVRSEPPSQPESQQVRVREIYCFDEHFPQHSLRVLEPGLIGLFPEGSEVARVLVRRGRGGFYYREGLI